jgi:hypothetical protein
MLPEQKYCSSHLKLDPCHGSIAILCYPARKKELVRLVRLHQNGKRLSCTTSTMSLNILYYHVHHPVNS